MLFLSIQISSTTFGSSLTLKHLILTLHSVNSEIKLCKYALIWVEMVSSYQKYYIAEKNMQHYKYFDLFTVFKTF